MSLIPRARASEICRRPRRAHLFLDRALCTACTALLLLVICTSSKLASPVTSLSTAPLTPSGSTRLESLRSAPTLSSLAPASAGGSRYVSSEQYTSCLDPSSSASAVKVTVCLRTDDAAASACHRRAVSNSRRVMSFSTCSPPAVCRRCTKVSCPPWVRCVTLPSVPSLVGLRYVRRTSDATCLSGTSASVGTPSASRKRRRQLLPAGSPTRFATCCVTRHTLPSNSVELSTTTWLGWPDHALRSLKSTSTAWSAVSSRASLFAVVYAAVPMAAVVRCTTRSYRANTSSRVIPCLATSCAYSSSERYAAPSAMPRSSRITLGSSRLSATRTSASSMDVQRLTIPSWKCSSVSLLHPPGPPNVGRAPEDMRMVAASGEA
mmetsp:Transcript_16684/g.56913  ORF Transcript_16684/g.56913 Transcript_16684/m.56913 type:complete len:378 (+) Transcript_16684:161-1294(+)